MSHGRDSLRSVGAFVAGWLSRVSAGSLVLVLEYKQCTMWRIMESSITTS
jgi:hypothetical protein